MKSVDKIHLMLLLPISSLTTVERYSLLVNTKGAFKTAHIVKADSIVVESGRIPLHAA